MTEEKKTGLPEEKNTGVLKGFRIQSLSLWLGRSPSSYLS